MAKKFKDTTVGQLLFGAASIINPTLGNVLQGVTSPKEAIAAIAKSDVSLDDKIKFSKIVGNTSKESQTFEEIFSNRF